MSTEIYPYSLLFVEDEIAIRQNYVSYLKLHFQNVYEAENGIEAYNIYKEKKPDIMIVDINIPMMNGLELLEKIRLNDQEIKAIMLTAHTDTDFLLQAASLKLNKYLIKPIARQELKNVLQETVKEIQNYRIEKIDKIEFKDGFSWDIKLNILSQYNTQIQLTSKEQKLLRLLCSKTNMTFTYDQISEEVWGYDSVGSVDSIKSLIKTLRKKLPKDSISNIFGIGFKIQQ